MDGWRIDVGYPEDRDEAEDRLAYGQDEIANDETLEAPEAEASAE